MAHTYSTPEARSRARRRGGAAPALAELLLLIPAALLAVAAVLLVTSAKDAEIADATARESAGSILNLNAASSADAIVAFLGVFPDERERRFVAREILDHVSGGGTGPTAGRALPNVGALARLTAEARRIKRTSGLTTLQARLQEARAAEPRRGARGDQPVHVSADCGHQGVADRPDGVRRPTCARVPRDPRARGVPRRARRPAPLRGPAATP